MKVTGPSGPSAPQTARPARAGGGFSLPQTGAAGSAQSAAATAGPASVADVSALMALQGVEDVMERRRRAVRRGSGILDRLEELKLALLSGEAGDGSLEKLARVMREERPHEEDASLTGLLDQIDLRAAVELAKADLRRSAA
ncbi:flagellar assembly protein FliX [uncultured Brevundimonas sp.]|uniref:flagellar assembly protein FliX n=1 Tax=uncultured Brevundimonas sp. TaxID=213418 RepID=UPI0025D534D3|nr:flagellar assembly protein FliX [uncultured Brevundimonas sp.]